MIRGNKAVVVDYKFGVEKPTYREKLTEYMDLLRQMGYSEVEGYIWYLTLGKVEKM
jgi:hypothetical protein